MKYWKRILTMFVATAFTMSTGVPVLANEDLSAENTIEGVYQQLFKDSLEKNDVVIVPEDTASTIPVAITRLENGKLAYTINGQPFYPRALENGWWDTRIPDEATNNEYFRTDTDWDYVFQDMSSIGANTMQLMVYWSDWEPVQGTYDFSVLDNVIEQAASYGLKTELIIFLHSHAISGVIPRSQDDFWAYHLDDRDGKCYSIQWGTENLNSTSAFRAAAAPGNGQEIFLEYWHPQVFPKLLAALTALADHYETSDDVIGYQLGNEEGFNYYVNNGKDQNPYYEQLKSLYMKENPGATEQDFRKATINNLWMCFNNAIHAGDAYKPTTSNLQSGLTEKSFPNYNPNDGTTIAFYENLDMIGSMFYDNAETIYPNLDNQYNGGSATGNQYATTLPLLFPTEIGANVKNSRVLKIIAAETMARGGQGFGVYCYGELYTDPKAYKTSPPKDSREQTKNLFEIVEAFQENIWAGMPVTAETTSNIFMTVSDASYNPTLSVLEANHDAAVGLLYFTGALGNNVNEENRDRNVTVSVKEAGTYIAEVRVTDGTEPSVYTFDLEENGQFDVPVTTTNYNVAFIEVKKDNDVDPPNTLDGNYRIQSVESGKYLTLQRETVADVTDDFVVLTSDQDAATVWTIEKTAGTGYFVLSGEKGMNIRFKGEGSNHIVVSTKNDNPNQYWDLEEVGESIYTICNQNTHQCMDSLGASEDGDKVEQRPSSGTATQQWRLVPLG